MGFILAATAGLVLWIVVWSIGLSAVDGALIVLLIVLVAIAVRRVRINLTSEPDQLS